MISSRPPKPPTRTESSKRFSVFPLEVLEEIITYAWLDYHAQGRWQFYLTLLLVSARWHNIVRSICLRNIVAERVSDLEIYRHHIPPPAPLVDGPSGSQSKSGDHTTSQVENLPTFFSRGRIVIYPQGRPHHGDSRPYRPQIGEIVYEWMNGDAVVYLAEIFAVSPFTSIELRMGTMNTHHFALFSHFPSVKSLAVYCDTLSPAYNCPSAPPPNHYLTTLRIFGLRDTKDISRFVRGFSNLEHLHLNQPCYLTNVVPFLGKLKTVTVDVSPIPGICGRAIFTSIRGWGFPSAIRKGLLARQPGCDVGGTIIVSCGEHDDIDGWKDVQLACDKYRVTLTQKIAYRNIEDAVLLHRWD
ncbi:hypothetical protein JAAARDRAFT_42459 [Jaapia argillacea MUCL 33604]|uniref:F-box domain-containing protein n=1 Tax=Jaapia argillacea MUCL 33604 TaxID=933084 RepID=A0A067P504_9AGAM|nr:hypothetical protein JAAARDRAFT_42459 [Jaapia argillacea MUCL 33604]